MGLDDIPSEAELTAYRLEAREWLAQNMPVLDPSLNPNEQSSETLKHLARTLYSGGYSGIAFPKEVGGAGLSRFHHRAFCEEAAGYEMPVFLGNPGLSIIAPPILEFGTDEQKEHIHAMLRGDELFVQMMSEPSGGSDMAGALTRADRDGDAWILNGSKIWSSGAWRADWGLILVRTNWDVPKHRGLSLFLLDLSLPGVTVEKIMMVDGSEEFCQEFFDDVILPANTLLGEPNDGWTVASRLLFHERDAVGGGSPYNYNRPKSAKSKGSRGADVIAEARRHGRLDDPRVQEMIGESHINEIVSQQLIERVTQGISSGEMAPIAGSLLRLNMGTTMVRKSTIALEIAGGDGITWDESDTSSHAAEQFIARQAVCIGGGTNEMQRNLISERLLGMPREFAADKDKAFKEVRMSIGKDQ